MAKATPPAEKMPVPMPPELAVEIEPFTDDDLDTAIDAIWAGDVDAVPAAVGTFLLSDEGRAEWAMRKLQGYTIRLAEIEQQYAYWLHRMEQRRDELTRRWAARAQVFETALQAYAVQRRRADPKNAATITLPSGVLKTTQGKQRTVHVEDDVRFARWAKAHLSAEQRHGVVVDVPKVYVQEVRKLPNLRVADDLTVEWSPDGENWITVDGLYGEAPAIKPTVRPDLTR